MTPETTAPSAPPRLNTPPDVAALLDAFPELMPVAQRFLAAEPSRSSYQMMARARQLVPDANARPANPSQTVAFFDLDGTVLAGSIIQHLTRQGFQEGQGKIQHVVQFLSCWVLYKLNLIPRATMYRWGYEPARGQDLKTVQEFVDRCLETHVKPRIFQEARNAISAHRAAGHRVVAITGAPDYAAAEICVHLGMHDMLATPTPLGPDGRITTNVQEPVCYAEGKLAYLHAYAAKHDVDLSKSFFYSDSASDIPVLKAVGRPRVVNAQALLRPVAWRHAWPVSSWKTLDQGSLPVASSSRAMAPVSRIS